jgi:hypothetical protein
MSKGGYRSVYVTAKDGLRLHLQQIEASAPDLNGNSRLPN